MPETPASPTTFEAPPGWPLEVGMQQRAAALKISRDIVKTQGSPFGGVSIHTEVADLIKMADYIVVGLIPDAQESPTA